jgi:hypothetical protein
MTLDEAKQSISDYINERWQPGSFLQAVLSNDLFEAIGRADEESCQNIKPIVAWVYNNVPSKLYGTREKVNNHLKGN